MILYCDKLVPMFWGNILLPSSPHKMQQQLKVGKWLSTVGGQRKISRRREGRV
jgi:hypothetical protein